MTSHFPRFLLFVLFFLRLKYLFYVYGCLASTYARMSLVLWRSEEDLDALKPELWMVES